MVSSNRLLYSPGKQMSKFSLGRFVLDFVYPPRCMICGTGGSFVCQSCEGRLPRADGRRCSKCWAPVTRGVCAACEESPPDLSSLRSCYVYDGEVRRLVHAFKFKEQTSLVEDLGRMMAESLPQDDLDSDILVPVPLTGLKQRYRGYNQARMLANQIGKLSGIAVDDLLDRRGNSGPQSQAGRATERRKNVTDAFRLRKGRQVSSRSILLVDDVATTGATLNACARVLLDGGAQRVSAITLARED